MHTLYQESESLNGSKWFSTFDLASGFWQIEMDQKDREKLHSLLKVDIMNLMLCLLNYAILLQPFRKQ